MTREELEKRLKKFSGKNPGRGICCLIPEEHEFIVMYFGDPFFDDEESEDGYDSTILYTTYVFNGTELIENRLSCFDYKAEIKKYDTDITKAVPDVLEYHYGDITDINVLPLIATDQWISHV